MRGGHSNPRQHSCLKNPMDRGAGELQSLRLPRISHDRSDLACTHAGAYEESPQWHKFRCDWMWLIMINKRCSTYLYHSGNSKGFRRSVFLKSQGQRSYIYMIHIKIIDIYIISQFSSVQSLSHVLLFATPWIAARQASLPITNSRSSLRLTSIESVMPSSHLILCRPLLLLPPSPPSIRVFSSESTLRMR